MLVTLLIDFKRLLGDSDYRMEFVSYSQFNNVALFCKSFVLSTPVHITWVSRVDSWF